MQYLIEGEGSYVRVFVVPIRLAIRSKLRLLVRLYPYMRLMLDVGALYNYMPDTSFVSD